LWDHQSDLPESWCQGSPAGRRRRAEAHIPETIGFQTKPQSAAGLVRRTKVLGIVPFDGITEDETSGRNGEFLDELEELGKRYVVGIPVTITACTVAPATCVPGPRSRGRPPPR
jgi:SRSO17 transposase